MAATKFVTRKLGTPVIWGEAGASGVTATLSADALASGSARMGASVDLGAEWDQDYLVILRVESGNAPTAAGVVDLYLAGSPDGSIWPAGVTGSDGAWPSDGNEDEWAKQLAEDYVYSFKATNDATADQTQSGIIWTPKARYVAPVIDNNMDQAIRDEATASNNGTRIFLYPLRTGLDGS